MREKILDLLKSSKSYSVKDIIDALGINSENEIRKILSEMCNELVLFKTKKNKYILFDNCLLKKGKISIAKGGYGFVSYGGDRDAFVHVRDLNGAINGDTVAIEIVKKDNAKVEAKVVKIASRESMPFIGEVVIKKNKTYILLDDIRIDVAVVLEDEKCSIVDGTKVVVNLKNEIQKGVYVAEVIEVLGHKNDPGVDLKSITRSYNIPDKFPSEVEAALKDIPSEVTDEVTKEMLSKGTVDLRSENIFTIDGDDTKDIDDAVSIKILENGNYELSVHIANVSHYVNVGSPIWTDAMNRGTSVYIPGASIPMLPRKLSNGICSLNPEVDRLALTFKMEIDNNGNVVDFDTFESIINSRKQMTYKNVNKILEENEIPEGYESFENDLKVMQKLAHKIRANRERRGSINFDINENKIEVDDMGKPVSVTLRPRGEAENLIEDFMVLTGESASKYLDDNGYEDAHIYRVHGEPLEEKINKYKAFLSSINCDSRRLDYLNGRNLQLFLDDMKDKKEYLIIAKELLKCMPKAVYSKDNMGHFALGSKSDCQVTSPIRRAGDLINHVLIKENIYHKKEDTSLRKQLVYLAARASLTERNAAECESAANKMKMAEYMQDHIGEEFEGIIIGIGEPGFAVELPNLIQGFVAANSLVDDNYIYNVEKLSFIGKTSNHKYSLGDTVTIKVKNASKEAKTIDFEIACSLYKKNIKVRKK